MNLKGFIFILFSTLFASAALAANPTIVIKTSVGTLEAELYSDKAPKTVENFLSYVKDGSYNGTIFHRVIKDFIIQGGNYDVNLNPRKRKAPVLNEADNGLKNEKGTLAMSRRIQKNSATNQFYINMKDNIVLNHVDKTDQGFGYAVFGKIIKGQKYLDKINSMDTQRRGVFPKLPVRNVVIKSIEIKK
ncbi:MAG: peptidyl-prolyl cis-trans isomerase A (cyclophilin A) [Bacteriovoracaceae bacterium]|jgi:peptidyl-prolyl cis-trans isomerase A (cyclophilin A)/peptidyl-prolyl cis-trans isomerase B (cyclophilin B)